MDKLTTRNFRLAKKYTYSAAPFATGILLSGSNAWGANYAVTPKSDIDILIITQDITKLERVIQKYIKEQLVGENEKKRFAIFKNFYRKGKTEQFSLIAKYEGVSISLDFFTSKTLHKITRFHRMKQRKLKGATLRVIEEFRLNPPKSDGYSVDGLDGTRFLYTPKWKKIARDGEECGYLSETLVDGRTAKNYFIGVMSFFLTVNPVILYEKEHVLSHTLNEMKSYIMKIQKNPITYITRQERMTSSTRARILKSFHHNL